MMEKGSLLAAYSQSIFNVFESHLKTEVDLTENDIDIYLKHYNKKFIT